jgi:uncharacterized protein (TIGR04255 family)
MVTTVNPLSGSPPEEVPLERAPLVRVIAQLNFSDDLSIANPDKVAPFQETLRSCYPFLKKEQIHQLSIADLDSPVTSKAQVVWRLMDRSKSWTISLSTNFLGVETTAYTSRSDFLEHLRSAVSALKHHFDPPEVSRLGIRYIDQITGLTIDQIAPMLREEVRGILGTSLAGSSLVTITESQFNLPDGRLVSRWGYLSKDVSIDPALLQPLDAPSWILDLDMSTSEPIDFSVVDIVNRAEAYAKRIYAMFRWAVNEDFLSHFGASQP